MLAACVAHKHDLTLTEVPTPALPPGGALIRVLGCGICGSDLDKLRHAKVPEGTILGHEVVGVIQALSPQAKGHFKVGDRVALAHHVPCSNCHYCINNNPSMCRAFKQTNILPGGFAELVAVTAGHLAHTVFLVPEHINDAVASCVEPVACVIRAVERGGLPLDSASVAVIGLGFIGQVAAQCYKQADCFVVGVDVVAQRCGLAVSHGFVDAAFHPEQHQEALTQTLASRTPTGGVDVVFLSAITPASLQLALDVVRDGGTLVVFAASLDGLASIPVNELYFREINVVSSYSPSVEHLGQAAQWIGQETINLEPLISHRVSLPELPQAMTAYQAGQTMKVFVSMRASWAFPDVQTQTESIQHTAATSEVIS
jgi:L-iditol 2-dehydrogenase